MTDLTLGILGSGQLGRMLTFSARQMGVAVHVFSPDSNSPAGQIADAETVAAYDDLDAARAFVRAVNVVTFEFENVPVHTVEAVAAVRPVRPGPRALFVSQNRGREKHFLRDSGLPCAPFRPVSARQELATALQIVGLPAILKTAGFGYDGKGQAKIESAAGADAAWDAVGGGPCILEGFVAFERELSVIGARGTDGSFAAYGPFDNRHVSGILDVTVCPAPNLPPQIAAESIQITRTVMEKLDAAGVLCVEFFLTTDGRLLVNELAPRPHNSGHLTIEAHVTSQFENQLRATLCLPLGDTTQRRPAAMANLLGDVWESGTPNWAAALALPDVHLHLYGKADARPGRKMGHLTTLADTPEAAEHLARAARARLTQTP